MLSLIATVTTVSMLMPGPSLFNPQAAVAVSHPVLLSVQ